VGFSDHLNIIRGAKAESKPAGPSAAANLEPLRIAITDAQYAKLAKLVYSLSGINLGDSKKELLKARLAKRMRTTGCRDVAEFICRLEEDQTGQELVGFLDCITTNKTDFFRESQHFDFLAAEVLRQLDKLCGPSEPLRVWSAACSTGEEPYTLAMVLQENREHWARRGAVILASDIDTQVLQHGQRGVYLQERAACIPRNILVRYFQKGGNAWSGYVRVKPELRKLVEFRKINLMDQFCFDRPMHVIFCRNVMIYFDKPTQQRLVQKFHDCLGKGGYLFVGHSESLTGIKHGLSFVRPAVYRKES